jgi:hypothetical protein
MLSSFPELSDRLRPRMTNWTKNPRNCLTLSELVKKCKHKNVPRQCKVYSRLLTECRLKPAEKYSV